MDRIPFNNPYITGKESQYISEAIGNKVLHGLGPFARKCEEKLEAMTGTLKGVVTHSCTGALELSGLLLDLQPGDEVIMPSYTFVSTANAFALWGAVPVFVDIRADTLNIDENLIEAAITSKTKVVVVVHYAGVACEMNKILDIVKKHELKLVEDAAQGVMAKYNGKTLGTIGNFGTYSFHDSKNIISGVGGFLLTNDQAYVSQVDIFAEKGTNQTRIRQGLPLSYDWVGRGSGFKLAELAAAFLLAQLEQAESITERRLAIWNYYQEKLAELEVKGLLRRPHVPVECEHNAHLYYVLIPSPAGRERILKLSKERNIGILTHYVPLHNSVAGLQYGRTNGSLPVTLRIVGQLLRLPVWIGLDESMQDRVIEVLKDALTQQV